MIFLKTPSEPHEKSRKKNNCDFIQQPLDEAHPCFIYILSITVERSA